MVYQTYTNNTFSTSTDDRPYVLLMTCDQNLADQINAYMHRQGIEVSTLSRRSEMQDWMQSQRPDIILIDNYLPDTDALSLCQELRQPPTSSYVPILVLVENLERQEELALRLSGADDYLNKPIIERDLLVRVMTLWRIKRQFDQLTRANQDLMQDLVSQNHALQQTLARQDELQRISDEAKILKIQVIDNVNHEFRTPLLQIKSAITILIDMGREASSDPQYNVVSEMAKQSVSRLEEIIENFSRLQLIENVKPSPMILRDGLRQGINSIRRSWSRRNDTGRIRHSVDDLTLLVMADRLALPRIMYLLLDNALKFSDAEIDLLVEAVGPSTLRIGVRDYGIGIAPHYHEQIFDAFFQVEHGSSRKYSGVGIGLTAAQMLAESMGTRIQVESQLGAGSFFYFMLPLVSIEAS